MKGRYYENDKILDSGCGSGRNMHWFLLNGFNIFGIDINEEAITKLVTENPFLPKDRLQVSSVEKMPFPDNHFNHVLSCAVLHFAISTNHFIEMFAEMVRVVKQKGTLFIRMASDIGIENNVRLIGDGVYNIPDGSDRFLLSKSLLSNCMKKHNLSFIEPLKTVNVDDVRCMSTLVLRKN